MNQLLIISDSHGLTNELSQIKERHQDIPYMVHCGDSELSEKSKYLEGYATVKGNCDWNGTFPNELDFEIDELTVFVTHGHLYSVKYSLSELIHRAKEVNANIVCSGHSHVAFSEVHDGILFINPGSIRLPKGPLIKTYAIASWVNRNHVKVDFFDQNGKLVLGINQEKEFQI